MIFTAYALTVGFNRYLLVFVNMLKKRRRRRRRNYFLTNRADSETMENLRGPYSREVTCDRNEKTGVIARSSRPTNDKSYKIGIIRTRE